MSKCNIKACGNESNGDLRYWCLTHKDIASKDGKELQECLCKYKDVYEEPRIINPKEVKSIKIIYENVLENLRPVIMINEKEEKKALKIEKSVIDFKDFGGLFISKLNNIDLIPSYCTYCNMPHTDDGLFAYTPHAKHLCQYCGYFYRVDEPNIGNELALYFNIPKIEMKDNKIELKNIFKIEYDLFNGLVLVNGQMVDKIKIEDKVILLKDYLNDVFKDEY